MPIYQLLIRLLSPLIWLMVLVETLKHRAGKTFWQQKLGLKFPQSKSKHLPTIWIHCASVGEVKAAEPLVHAIQDHYQVVITTNTPTSRPIVAQVFGDSVQHFYLPFDWPFALKRFMQKIQPQQLWVMETELWPNLFRVAHKRGVTIRILNGRLTPKTFKAPRWLIAAFRNGLRRVDTIIARSEADAERFQQMGASADKIHVLGNIKYAAQPHFTRPDRPIERPYIVAASTHEDEELQITQHWLNLNRPELLVIVPRHPKRSSRIQTQLEFLESDLKVATKGETADASTKVYLDDRIGKLLPLYAYAEVVIMGGSFVPKGGHNILEPAAFKKAILSGSDARDFADEMALLKEYQGIIQCKNYSEMASQLEHLLNHPEEAQKLGEQAFLALQAQKDTLKHYLQILAVNHTNATQQK